MSQYERDHTDHSRQMLATWRLHLLARLAAERANFLWQLRRLDEETLSRRAVTAEWTVKDFLPHIGAWDAFHSGRITLLLDGRKAEMQPLGGEDAMHARNAELYRRYKDISLELALATFLKERSAFQVALARAGDVDLHRTIRMPWGWRTSIRRWAQWRYEHDADHAHEIEAWRQALPKETRRCVGPAYGLRAMLKATRKEFLSLVALLPEAEREARPVCGIWTMKDLIGHLTDWELVGVQALRQVVAGQEPEFDAPITDFDAFNEANAAARKDQPWAQVMAAFTGARVELLNLFDQLAQDDLAYRFTAPWQRPVSVYNWLVVWAGHEREHAVDVRRALNLPRTPGHLLHFSW